MELSNSNVLGLRVVNHKRAFQANLPLTFTWLIGAVISKKTRYHFSHVGRSNNQRVAVFLSAGPLEKQIDLVASSAEGK